jgi:hypothetical protein
MEHKGSDDAAVDPLAIPALYPHQESDSVPAIVLDADGEVFESSAQGEWGHELPVVDRPEP